MTATFEMTSPNVAEAVRELIERAEAGQTIILTRNGQPVACLGPLPAKKPIRYGDLADLGPLPSDDLSLPQEVLDEFEESIERTARQIQGLDCE